MDASAAFRTVEPTRFSASVGAIGHLNDRDALRELEQIAHVRTYRAGETVLAELEECTFVGSVVSGILRMQKTLHDGRQQIVGLLRPADMFGTVFEGKSHVSVEAATDATLRCYSRKRYEAILQRHPELIRKVVLTILQDLHSAQDWMLLLAAQTVTERVATFLLWLQRGLPDLADPDCASRTAITVPIGRRDVAAYLGTTVESVSRSIQELARRGAIEIVDPQHFIVNDCDRLLQLSGRDWHDFETVPAPPQRHLFA